MGVGSATEGNSNIGGTGSVSNAGALNENKSASTETSKITPVSAEPTKLDTQSLSTTYASKTGLSTAVAKAKVAGKIDDKKFDGHFVGANGQTYPANTPLNQIAAVTPANGVTNDRTIIHVNGIRTDVAGQSSSLQAIADQTGSRVIGVHNATGGTIRDLGQSLGDKINLGNNPAVDTLADTIYNELKAGRQVDLMAHSQGALIASRALTDVRNRLQLEDGMTRKEAETALGNVRAETFGGASRRFPDGPQYVHYVNKKDFVPMAFGLRNFLNPFARPGSGAVTHYFKNSSNAHSFNNTYLPERVPFEQARQGNFD